MDFITRCCKNVSVVALPAARAFTPWLAAALALLLALVIGTGSARGEGIEVRSATVIAADDGYALQAQLDVRLTPVVDDALHKGVPLYFVLDFEMIRSRWYWTNERIGTLQQQQRLSYNTLTRQYRVGAGALYQNFSTLKEALDTMSRVYRRLDIEAGALRKDTTYAAAMRLRLDTTQLPKPFQLHTGRNWDMASDWYRWTVTP